MAHLQPITPLTIEAIRANVFVGNAWSDGPAFASIDTFAANPANPIAHRAEALRIMIGKGMGCDDAPEMTMPDDDVVAVFMADRE